MVVQHRSQQCPQWNKPASLLPALSASAATLKNPRQTSFLMAWFILLVDEQ
jgi:hypothetical protein